VSYKLAQDCEIITAMKKAVDVSIIYVNYNTQALVEDSLRSVIKNPHSYKDKLLNTFPFLKKGK